MGRVPEPAKDAAGYSSHAACRLTGLNYRQLDYLCRTVLDETPGSGGARRFNESDIALLTVCRRLRSLGSDGEELSRVVRELRSRPQPTRGWIVVTDELVRGVTSQAMLARVLAEVEVARVVRWESSVHNCRVA